MPKPAPLTPTALRTRWALLDLAAGARHGGDEASRRPTRSVSALGLSFPSPLGLAAGFDRGGTLIGQAGRLGLGAVEIGSLCARSRDLARTLHGLRRRDGRPCAIHGVSVAKRVSTAWSLAQDELIGVLRQLHGLADYLTLNPGRDCPDPSLFAALLGELARERDRLARTGRRTPLVAKLSARWLACGDPAALGQAFASHSADGLLLAAEGSSPPKLLDTLHRISQAVGPKICLISVGGITQPEDVRQRLQAGATLVQVHGALRRSSRHGWIRKINRGSGLRPRMPSGGRRKLTPA